MEEDFAGFILMMLICCLPFGFIYLVLNLLNWNERKNLLSNSWFVYLAWLFSSFLIVFVYVLIENKLVNYSSGFTVLLTVVFSMICLNICFISGVLYLKNRKENAFDVTNYIDEEIQKPNIKKIWQASAIISVATLMMVGGLVMAIADINGKWEKQKTPNKLSFGVYDI